LRAGPLCRAKTSQSGNYLAKNEGTRRASKEIGRRADCGGMTLIVDELITAI
jgi:hypothetical protein